MNYLGLSSSRSYSLSHQVRLYVGTFIRFATATYSSLHVQLLRCFSLKRPDPIGYCRAGRLASRLRQQAVRACLLT